MHSRTSLRLALAGAVALGAIVVLRTSASARPEQSSGAVAAAPGVDIFLGIAEIPGEAMQKGREQKIEVATYALGVEHGGGASGGRGGMTTGRAQASDMVITKRVDASSPKLFEFATNGRHLPSATLTVVRRGSVAAEMITYELTDVVVNSYQVTSGTEMPMDQVSLGYSRIEVTYTPMNMKGGSQGTVSMSWDLNTNKTGR